MKTKLFSLLLLGVFLVGCANVKTSKVESVDLSKYDTYAWLPVVKAGEKEALENENFVDAIVEAANNQLQARNYNLDNSNPDFLIQVHAMINEKTELQYDPLMATYDYYGTEFYTPYTSPYLYTDYLDVGPVTAINPDVIDVVEYTKGRIVVDIVDAESNEVVWRGYLIETLEENPEQEDFKDHIDDIFDEYPVDESV